MITNKLRRRVSVRPVVLMILAVVAVGSLTAFDLDSFQQLLDEAEVSSDISLERVIELLGDPMFYVSRLGKNLTFYDSDDLPDRYTMVYGWNFSRNGQTVFTTSPNEVDVTNTSGSECVVVDVVDGYPSKIGFSWVSDFPAHYRGVYLDMPLNEFISVVEPKTIIDLDEVDQPPETYITQRDQYGTMGLQVYAPRDRILFYQDFYSGFLDISQLLTASLHMNRQGEVRVFRVNALLNEDKVDPLRGL